MTELLRLDGMYAGYGDRIVLRDLSLTVSAGEVVGLFGSNGAGKTTTLAVLAGLLPLRAGSVELLGSPVKNSVRPHSRARAGVSLVPENRGLFRQLSVADNLRMAHRGRGRRAATDEVLASFPKLQPLVKRQVGLLSGGEQQMLVLARALLTRPKLLLVDEMSMGLAPLIAEDLLTLLRGEAERRRIGVLVVEQHIPLALRFVDRAYVLSHGDLVRAGAASELAADEDLVSATYLGA